MLLFLFFGNGRDDLKPCLEQPLGPSVGFLTSAGLLAFFGFLKLRQSSQHYLIFSTV